MPRKKRSKSSSLPSPVAFADIPTNQVKRSRSRTVVLSLTHETGDATQDGRIWLQRIAMTRRLRAEQENGERDWRRYYRWYEGNQWLDRGQLSGSLASDAARDTATVNKTGSIINSMVPFLVNGRIRFLLKARKPGETDSAHIQQSLLNYEWIERGMTRQLKRCVKDATIIGHCVGKTGYTVEVAEAVNPDESGEINYADYVRKDAPWFERVDPLWFFFDLSAKDCSLHTARWCAEVFFVPFNDVMANSAYDQNVLQGMYAGEYSPTTRAAFEGIGQNDPQWLKQARVALPEDHLTTLIEIWDKKFKQRIIYADGVPQPLLVEPWPYEYLDNFPYAMANYIDVPNKPYGIGVPRWIEDQQIQLNRIRTGQFNHIRSHQRKFIAKTGIDPNELTKFTDGGDGTVVIAEDADAIKPIPDAPMSQDFQIVEARIVSDMDEMSGADALLQGRALPSRTTAGEVGTRARILGLKTDAIVDNVEEFTEEIATQILQHLKKNRIVPDVVRIVGPQGAEWREYTSDEIQAETDVEVESFTAPKEDPSVLRQQWLQQFQLVVQSIPVLQQTGQIERLDFGALFGRVLESFGEKDVERFWKPTSQVRSPVGPGGSTGGAGSGLPPALAGQLAPAQVPTAPSGPGNPNEGLSLQDLMMQLEGSAVTNG
ncbi:MAG TPA: hypothetical protein VJ302_16815 [Blastocatellia bacterium]|nr:hypothetical protein [Blastocatellia bacterium]